MKRKLTTTAAVLLLLNLPAGILAATWTADWRWLITGAVLAGLGAALACAAVWGLVARCAASTGTIWCVLNPQHYGHHSTHDGVQWDDEGRHHR